MLFVACLVVLFILYYTGPFSGGQTDHTSQQQYAQVSNMKKRLSSRRKTNEPNGQDGAFQGPKNAGGNRAAYRNMIQGDRPPIDRDPTTQYNTL